jgi:hypothetical protein
MLASVKVFGGVALILAVYFPAALWMRANHEPPKGPIGGIHKLQRTFVRLPGTNGRAFVALVPSWTRELADDADHPERSPLVVYEDGKPLGPEHTEHVEIVAKGGGRFSHWKGIGMVFSSSDGSDPNDNKREYWAVIPVIDPALAEKAPQQLTGTIVRLDKASHEVTLQLEARGQTVGTNAVYRLDHEPTFDTLKVGDHVTFKVENIDNVRTVTQAIK